MEGMRGYTGMNTIKTLAIIKGKNTIITHIYILQGMHNDVHAVVHV